jgi:anti-sigma B factor antagonist
VTRGGSNSEAPFSGAADEHLSVSLGHLGSCVVLDVAGELDISTIDTLRAALDPLVADGLSDVVVDLSGLRFLDASGLGVLVRAQRRLRVRRRSLALVCRHGPVPRLLGLTGLRHVLRAFETVDAAAECLELDRSPGGVA